ncbi:TPA: hypothetical protein IAA82_03425 [Candidatus Galligastranaerophilus gallistercoris]|nr:hypothetical protein [Candidatus Galligastranaerophilus gallistercoris]
MYTEEKDCKPIQKERENKHHSADFNCGECNQTDCIYWLLYNGYLSEENIRER